MATILWLPAKVDQEKHKGSDVYMTIGQFLEPALGLQLGKKGVYTWIILLSKGSGVDYWHTSDSDQQYHYTVDVFYISNRSNAPQHYGTWHARSKKRDVAELLRMAPREKAKEHCCSLYDQYIYDQLSEEDIAAKSPASSVYEGATPATPATSSSGAVNFNITDLIVPNYRRLKKERNKESNKKKVESQN